MKTGIFTDKPAYPLQLIGEKMIELGVLGLKANGHERGAVIAIVVTPETYAEPELSAKGLNQDGVLTVLGRSFASMAVATGRDPESFVRALVHGAVGCTHATDDGQPMPQPPNDPTCAEAVENAEAANAPEAMDPETERFFGASCEEANGLLQRFHREGRAMTKEFTLGMMIAAVTHLRANDVSVGEMHGLLEASVGLTRFEREPPP